MAEKSFNTKTGSLLVTVHYEYEPYKPEQEDQPEHLADVNIKSVISDNGQDIKDTLNESEIMALRSKCFSDIAKG